MHGVPIRDELFGRESCRGGGLARHRHRQGYVTLVLSGGYSEAGDAGRYKVAAGSLLIHRPFEAHLDDFGGRGAEVLNLPLIGAVPGGGAVHVEDPDRVARLAEKDVPAAAELVWSAARRAEPENDWPDLLAEALRRPMPIGITQWARRYGLDPATVSRGFRQAFGTTPSRYRAEARARLAAQAAIEWQSSFADLAAHLGFADQAHMTRAVASLTGMPPLRWRRRVKPVQDQPRASA